MHLPMREGGRWRSNELFDHVWLIDAPAAADFRHFFAGNNDIPNRSLRVKPRVEWEETAVILVCSFGRRFCGRSLRVCALNLSWQLFVGTVPAFKHSGSLLELLP